MLHWGENFELNVKTAEWEECNKKGNFENQLRIIYRTL